MGLLTQASVVHHPHDGAWHGAYLALAGQDDNGHIHQTLFSDDDVMRTHLAGDVFDRWLDILFLCTCKDASVKLSRDALV